MDKELKIEKIVLPVINIDCAESTKSNYANYMSVSSTNDASALIDIIENVTIIVGPINY